MPERTCVGCRRKAPKDELVRIVRSPSGVVHVDPTGKAPGRGAYVHPHPVCLQAALSRGRLGRALRTRMSPDEARRLEEAVSEGAL